MMTSAEETPSVWIETKTRGEICYGVKVYDDDVDVAMEKAMSKFRALKAFVAAGAYGEVPNGNAV